MTFNPGVTSQSVLISTNDDALDESDGEAFTVTLSSPTNVTIGTGTATGTINDNDAEPALSIANATAVAEGAAATFDVTLSAPSDQTVTVDYARVNGTTSNGDFVGPTSGTLTFAPGDTSETISIGTTDDALDEATESFTVTLASPANATIANGSGSGSITDNDPTPTSRSETRSPWRRAALPPWRSTCLPRAARP